MLWSLGMSLHLARQTLIVITKTSEYETRKENATDEDNLYSDQKLNQGLSLYREAIGNDIWITQGSLEVNRVRTRAITDVHGLVY
jgi:hypothetical protein